MKDFDDYKTPESLIRIFEIEGKFETEKDFNKISKEAEKIIRKDYGIFHPCLLCYKPTAFVGLFIQKDGEEILGKASEGMVKIATYPMCMGHSSRNDLDKIDIMLRRIRL